MSWYRIQTRRRDDPTWRMLNGAYNTIEGVRWHLVEYRKQGMDVRPVRLIPPNTYGEECEPAPEVED